MTVDLLAPLFLVKGSPGVIGYIILALFLVFGAWTVVTNRRKR